MRRVTPGSLGLPYDEWRPGQLEVINVLKEATEENIGKLLGISGAVRSSDTTNTQPKTTFLNLPTGSGKSGCILGLHAATGQRTVALTVTKQLQEQYAKIAPDILSIKGKNNYSCLIIPSLTVDIAPCQYGWQCPVRMRCPYFLDRSSMETAPFVVTNYDFALPSMNFVHTLRDVKILGCDEGHMVESVLLDFVEISIPKQFYSTQSIDLPRNRESLASWKEWAATITPLMSKRLNDLTSKVKAIGEGMGLHSDMEHIPSGVNTELIREFKAVEAAAHGIFRLASLDSDWFIQEEPRKYSIKPIWGTGLFDQYLGAYTERAVLMSATLTGAAEQAEILGISDYQYIELPSMWPVENRLFHVYPVANMTQKTMTAADPIELKRLVRAIDQILTKHGTVKGIIHTTNYRVADYILQNSKHGTRLMTHRGEDRAARLSEFILSTKPVVMISPSFHLGIDIPGQIKFQICTKVPYPSLGDTRVRLRLASNPKWYMLAAANTLVQQHGRGTRAPEDQSVTFMLDSQFLNFYSRAKNYFPGHFLEAIRWHSE